MVHTLPAIANPLAPAVELARSLPTQIVAAAVGALVGIALFSVMTLIVARRRARPAFQAAATDLVFIPPYPPAPRPVVSPPAPLPPRGPTTAAPVSISDAPRRPLGFVPSTALSARAFAKMGYSFATPESIPCVVESVPAVASSPAIETGPMSAVSMTTSANILAAAPIAALDLDDGPTELCEPYFDVPPQPRRRGARPKIRPIAPSPPRYPAVEPVRRGMLPVGEVERAPATLRWSWMPPAGT